MHKISIPTTRVKSFQKRNSKGKVKNVLKKRVTKGHVRTAYSHNPLIFSFHLDKAETGASEAEEDVSSATVGD